MPTTAVKAFMSRSCWRDSCADAMRRGTDKPSLVDGVIFDLAAQTIDRACDVDLLARRTVQK